MAVEIFWVRIKGQTNEEGVVVEIYYWWPPSKEDDTEDVFFMELRYASKSSAIVIIWDFNLPDVTESQNGRSWKAPLEITLSNTPA